MSKKIELSLSFFTDPDPAEPPSDPQGSYGNSTSGAGDVQDTIVVQRDALVGLPPDTVILQQATIALQQATMALQQATAALRMQQGQDEPHEENMAKLEQLQIKQRTVAEVVRSLGTVLGHEVYPSRIVQQDDGIIKVVLEIGGRQQLAETEILNEPISESIHDVTDGGEINTTMFRHPEAEDMKEDHMFGTFNTRFTQAPCVIIGLNYLDAKLTQAPTFWVSGSVVGLHQYIFQLHSYSPDLRLRATGFTWLAVPSYEYPLLQAGTFEFTGVGFQSTTITFTKSYTSRPKVVVWLNAFGLNSILDVHTTDITATGFKVHLSSDIVGASKLSISWLAYPADTPGICSGRFIANNGSRTVQVVSFTKPFAKPPRRVLVALNGLAPGSGSHIRFRITQEAVTEYGMAVRVESWGTECKKILCAAVSYIAME